MSSNAKDLNTTQVDEDDEPDDWYAWYSTQPGFIAQSFSNGIIS